MGKARLSHHQSSAARCGGGPFLPREEYSYAASRVVKAFIEPRAVNDALPSLPLFLTRRTRVALPLESSYLKAFAKVPAHFRVALQTG